MRLSYRFDPGGTNLRSSYVEVRSQDVHDTARPFKLEGEAFRVRDLLPALSLLGAGLLALLVASIWSDATDDKFVVITPPGWSQGRTVALVRGMDGTLVRTGNFANVVFAASADPAFAARARAAGAWLVAPAPLAAGCTDSSLEPVL
ncbi:hypothetical protein EDF58_105393 [Novosphingobium sp. PhB57]|jgi:hypothetical protein|nr:hypothetical protein EDF58_105393 [Novosphingobium sp. PhB57]TDW67123.1 hypothetical protein EDF57_1026 [Novosphingobium sp. PhB55]